MSDFTVNLYENENLPYAAVRLVDDQAQVSGLPLIMAAVPLFDVTGAIATSPVWFQTSGNYGASLFAYNDPNDTYFIIYVLVAEYNSAPFNYESIVSNLDGQPPAFTVSYAFDYSWTATSTDFVRSVKFVLQDSNEAPTATKDTGFTALIGAAKAIPIAALLANDTDPDIYNSNFNQLSIIPTSLATTDGSVTVSSDGLYVLFTPNRSGDTSFTYQIQDNGPDKLKSNTATVSVYTGTIFSGENGNDSPLGTAGDDVRSGGNGNDTLFGLGGDDTLLGDSGNDTLNGGDGADKLTGGRGRDILTGGDEVDTFRFTNNNESLLNNFDLITDLAIGTDIIDGPNAVSAGNIFKGGTVSALTQSGISAVLTSSNFRANGAATFTFGTRTFLALNNNVAGFSASDDAIIEITGYTPSSSGSLNNLAIV